MESSLKAGAYDNELSRFRYDVTLRLGEKAAVVAPQRWLSWEASGAWRETLEEALRRQPGVSVGMRGIRDRRVAGAVEAVRLLHDPGCVLADAEELEAVSSGVSGEHPDAVVGLARGWGSGFAGKGLGRMESTMGYSTPAGNLYQGWHPSRSLTVTAMGMHLHAF